MSQQWFERQLLPPRHATSIADVVTHAGWIPSAGGTGPYLAIRARIPDATRQDVDDAVFERMEIMELPSVRDTAFLVPCADAGIALAAGRRSYAERLRKLPLDASELASLGNQILKALGGDARTTDQLRRDLPTNSIRDLGDAGKRLGITSTLTAALKLLQVEGKVLRSNVERRLDGRTHIYQRWPRDIDTTPPPDLDRALAARFLAWSAPSDVEDFAWWSGMGKRAAKAAMASLRIDDVSIPPRRSDDAVILLPFRDNLFGLHRGLAPFVDDDDAEVMDTSGRAIAAKDAEMLHHNAILAGGMLRGIWEYDGSRIVTKLFGNPPRGLATAIAEMETFIREQLGDHKYYAFDSAATRAKRVGFVRQN
jgi:hypothetical protein